MTWPPIEEDTFKVIGSQTMNHHLFQAEQLIQNYNEEAEEEKTSQPSKERMTVQISKNTVERVKDCVYWNRLTLAQFVEDALETALVEAEKQNGKPFDKRRSELKPGRPIK